MKRKAWSLRKRLIALLAALAFAAWAASSVWLYRSAEQQAAELSDAALVEAAHAVLAAAAHEGLGNDDDFEFEVDGHAHVERLYYQIRDRRGAIVYVSAGAPREALAAADARGFSERVANGIDYRVYSLRAPDGRAAIHLGQRIADRTALVRSMTLRFLLPGLAMVVLLAAGAWFVVQRVMSPVISFSRVIDERAPSDSGPVVVDDLPQELQPVGRAVNGLLGRVESALTHERTLTADAAHELRTPLAALRAQAQVALRARDETERRGALQALIGGVDRATRLVESVLTLARLDARSIDPAGLPSVSLQETVAELADELGPAARARRVELQLQLPDLSVRADGDSLRLALRNLCENAIRHANSCVRVGALPAANQVVLSVRDDGPGMSAEQKSRAFDRFYRGTTDGIGAGLGLALVKRVAEQHGGSVRFSEGLSGRGLGVELVLPDAKVSP